MNIDIPDGVRLEELEGMGEGLRLHALELKGVRRDGRSVLVVRRIKMPEEVSR